MRTLILIYILMAMFVLHGLAFAGDSPAILPAASPAMVNSVAHEAPLRTSNSNLIWGLRWGNGLEYELGSSGRVSRVKARHPESDVAPFHGKIGVKLHLDAADYQTASGMEEIPSDSGVRRARVYTTGNFFMISPVFYKIEAEVADGDFYIRETYLSLADLPYIQTLKVGHFKAPMTLEGYTGSGDTLFMERAAPIEAFGPGIMYGIQPAGVSADKRATWAFGWFADGGQNDISEASRSPTRAIGRVTWLPVYDDGSGDLKLIHLGTSAQFLYSEQNTVQYRSRPESYFAPRLIDTGPLDAQESLTIGVEFATENGPLSVQSEFLQSSVYGYEDESLCFRGFYVAGSWLMTGESRPYNRNAGAFGRVSPRKPFSLRERTFGAWELVSRFSRLDLNDQEVKGGIMNLVTVGVNGYLTSRVKVMLDYAFGQVDHIENDGDVRILEGRVQYEF
jgi:phosphate-selective porin OprO/OprP